VTERPTPNNSLAPSAQAPATSLIPAPRPSEDEQLAARRLQLFMGTRLGVATLLLGGTLIIALANQHGFHSFTPRFLVSLIAVIYGTSLVFAVWLLGSKQRERIAIAQVACDLLFTTGLAFVTGGVTSGFTFLYGVAVLMAAMVIGPSAARAAGVIAVGLYCALASSLYFNWLAPPPDQSLEAYRITSSELVYAGLLNIMGLALVTILASNLSQRLLQTGGQLRLLEASAATLARLNDDIVRSMSSGLLTTDLEGRIRTINPTGVEMFRVPADELIGKPVSWLLPVDATKALSDRLAEDGALNRADGRARRPDGTSFPVGYSLNPLINLDGAAIGILLVFQDLSEIEALRESAARQDRLAVLGRLSAGLAHEIRNPLSSISGSVQLVRDSLKLDGDDKRLLGIVLNEVERLDELVSTMLQVGKPPALQRSQQDMRTIVEGVTAMARTGPALTSGIRIDTVLPDQPVSAWVDGHQTRQVLWNLLKNALQASPANTVIRARCFLRADGFAVLEVADEGVGIDRQQREKIYDMFHSERTHGAGIGLALVRQIVDAHHGTIDIESEQHHGATFIVAFPPRSPSGRTSATSDGPDTT
jgi:two-component system, NtrC family, sensor histidine kinase PilS